MKIAIKLKRDELHSLVQFMEDSLPSNNELSDRMEVIIVTLLLKFYLKLKQKSIIMDKSSLTVNVEFETALAFVEYFAGYPVNCYSHAGNVVMRMIAVYDQKTA